MLPKDVVNALQEGRRVQVRLQGSGFTARGLGFRVQDSGSGFRVHSSGFRVQGSLPPRRQGGRRAGGYRGSSLTKIFFFVGPYSRTVPRAL